MSCICSSLWSWSTTKSSLMVQSLMPSISHTLSSKSADATACLSCMDGSASRQYWIFSLCSSPRQYTLIESLDNGYTTSFSSMLYSILMLPNEQRALRCMHLMFGMCSSSHSSGHFASWAFTSSRVIVVSLLCRAVGKHIPPFPPLRAASCLQVVYPFHRSRPCMALFPASLHPLCLYTA